MAAPRARRPDGSETALVHAVPPAPDDSPPHFPIVGVGASAGGLEAVSQLLERIPADTGMALCVVQHLAPNHDSLLAELLSRKSHLPVSEVVDGVVVEPDHAYVIAPDCDLRLDGDRLRLTARDRSQRPPLPIDSFFRSLASTLGHRAIGVVLSGAASDGTLGMGAIKAEGGITFAQDPASAKYDGMPRAAIAAGAVDFVLTPRKIAAELKRLARHPYVAPATSPEGPPAGSRPARTPTPRSSASCDRPSASTSPTTSSAPSAGGSRAAWRCATSRASTSTSPCCATTRSSSKRSFRTSSSW